jgi:hypothetical protein
MAGELLYLDSSALVKLVLPEAESEALLESLSAWPVRITSDLARVEVVRATRRATQDPARGGSPGGPLSTQDRWRHPQRGNSSRAADLALPRRRSSGFGSLAGSRSGTDRDL